MSTRLASPEGNPYLSLLRTSWRYARGERGRFVLVHALYLFTNIVLALEPILWGWLIGRLQVQGTDGLRDTWLYIAGYLLIKLLDWALHGPARIMERTLAFRLGRNFLHDIYHQTLYLPVRWHQDNHSGAIMNRVRKAHEALKVFFENGYLYANALGKFVLSFLAMVYFSPLFGSIAVLMGLAAIGLILRFDRPFVATLRQVNEREHVYTSTLFDSLSNIVTVITLRLQPRMEEGVLRRIADIFPFFRRNVLLNEYKWFVVDMAIGLIYCVILAGYMHQNWRPGETFLIGGLVTLMGYVSRFTSVFQNIAVQYTQVVRYQTDVQSVQPVLDAYARQHLPAADRRLPAGWREIAIGGLTFRHGDAGGYGAHRPGVEEVRLRLVRGKRIALIGESGSGKSTLLALLRGLHTPEEGVQVSVDGHPLDSLGALAGHVTLLPQEPEIFENTIEYNITLGLPFDPEEVAEVCETAHFAEVAGQLPAGLQSSIKEKGVNLSGGQKQRLALARGVLAARDSDIVLLDEPTSSVDTRTEGLIYERLFRQFADKVVVSAMHRLHLLPRFDYIYVFEKGRIVEEGSFADLRRHGRVFNDLWRHQAGAGETKSGGSAFSS